MFRPTSCVCALSYETTTRRLGRRDAASAQLIFSSSFVQTYIPSTHTAGSTLFAIKQ